MLPGGVLTANRRQTVGVDQLREALSRISLVLHLAAALELGDELEAFGTYDGRMAKGAEALGINVVAPV